MKKKKISQEECIINQFKADAFEKLILMLQGYLDDNMVRFTHHHLNQLRSRIEKAKFEGNVESLIEQEETNNE